MYPKQNDERNILESHTPECYIVGGGPSLRGFDWTQLDGNFVIAINRAYEKLPNADVVYFTDHDWYTAHKLQLSKHIGRKVKGSIRPSPSNEYDEYLLTTERGLQTIAGQLSHGCNSTYAAVNLAAVHLGFTEIYLLGVDMQHNSIGNSHWHSGHNRVDPVSVYDRMMENFNRVTPILAELGVNVYNINTPEQSKLDCFPFSDKLTLGTGNDDYEASFVRELEAAVSPRIRKNVKSISARRQKMNEIKILNQKRREKR
jgi:hypothetical protein